MQSWLPAEDTQPHRGQGIVFQSFAACTSPFATSKISRCLSLPPSFCTSSRSIFLEDLSKGRFIQVLSSKTMEGCQDILNLFVERSFLQYNAVQQRYTMPAFIQSCLFKLAIQNDTASVKASMAGLASFCMQHIEDAAYLNATCAQVYLEPCSPSDCLYCRRPFSKSPF